MSRKIRNTLTVALLGLMMFVTFGFAASPASASTAPGNPLPTVYTYDFNSTLQPWQPDATKGTDVSADIAKGNLGHTFASVGLDAVGAGWIENSYQIAANSVQMKFQARNLENCVGCKLLVYVGGEEPKSLADFTVLSDNIPEDWGNYAVTMDVPAGSTTTFVAIGYQTPPFANPVGEYKTIAGFDNLTVYLQTRQVQP